MQRKTFKYRLYPTPKQEKIMELFLETCREVYNKSLNYKNKKWKEEKIFLTKYDLHYILTDWLHQDLFPKNVYKQCLYEAQERIDIAFKRFKRATKKGVKVRPPKPRKEGRYHSFTYPQMRSNIRFVGTNKIRLPKIGLVKIKQHRPIEGKIKRLIVKRTNTNKWYLLIYTQEPQKNCKINDINNKYRAIGIDLGIKTFATLSDGTKIENPRFLKQKKKILTRTSKKFKKATKHSTVRKQNRKIIANLHEKSKNQRLDFIHKLTKKLVDTYDIICIENLNTLSIERNCNKMKNIKKALRDTGLSTFIALLSYKAEQSEKILVRVHPSFTSKLCSKCGNIKEDLTIDDNIYMCNICGLEIDRDENAAINILRLGLQSLGIKSLEATNQ